ncbi:MAG: hypothetical protein H7Y05_15000 [Steroidobacteraceae bacterium]|nr:hypothetical protein [Deltaproteobacteria bacterium]
MRDGLRTYLAQKLFGAQINSLVDAGVDQRIDRELPALVATRVDQELQARITASSLSFEEVGFRKLTGNPSRILPVATQERMFEICYWLWKTNPLAQFIIDIIVAFVVEGGMPITSDNDEVKTLLTEFWEDTANQMDLFFEKHVTELGVFGELCLPVFVLANTGKVRLGYIDPADIESVVTDPHNAKITIGINLKSQDYDPARKLKVIIGDEETEILSPRGRALYETFTDGQCFYWKVNTLTNEPRGCSDLFVVADHLDGYEQFMADTMEKFSQYNAFYWDVKVEGADNEELQKKADLYRPPRSGGAFIHNEKVTSEAISPTQNASDAETGSRLLRNHILGPKGIPEHWVGGGGNVNRATASEMDLPVLKMLGRRQKTVKHILEQIADFVIASALNARYLRIKPEEATYEIQTPEISSKEVGPQATALQSLSVSLTAAQANGWIDQATARKMFAFGCDFVGFKYDPEAQDIPEPGYQDYRKDKNGPVSADQSKTAPSTGKKNGSGL